MRETRPEIAAISILCFGDSLTAGSMDTSYTHHPYSTKLQEYLNVRDRRMLDETVKPVFKVFPAGLPSERAKPRLKQLLQDLKITYYRVIIHGGTNDLKKYEENSSFDFYDVLSIFNALVKLHNVSHTFGARSVAVSIPEVECEISETCPNFKKARNKINEPLQSFVARNKRYIVLTDFANEIMYRSRDQNLWSGPVHFLPAVFRSRLEQKSPVTECLVCCVCVLFPMKESMIRIDSWFVSIAMTFYFLALSATRVPLGQCSGVSLL